MKTTEITIRPFKPTQRDETKDKREPYAILSYGNVHIEIDYTLLNSLSLDLYSDIWQKTNCILNAGVKEMLREMAIVLYGIMPKHHRDTQTNYTESFTHNPLHKDNEEIRIGKMKEISNI
jgi:hypothetical protein